MGDGAVGTISGADVAEDHEGGGAVLPALTHVWAVSFLTDSVKIELPHEVLQVDIILTAWRAHLEPGRLSIRQRSHAVAPADLIKRVAHISDVGRLRLGRLNRAATGQSGRKPLIWRNVPTPGNTG